jgi:hypothetical protein
MRKNFILLFQVFGYSIKVKNTPIYFRNHRPFILTNKKSSHGDAAILILSYLKGGSTSGEDEESAGEIIGIETKVCIM